MPFDLRMHVDRCSGNEISGWIDEGKDDPEPFDLFLNGTPCGTLSADQYRPDLEKFGCGNGRRGFAHRFESPLKTGDYIELKRRDATVFVIGVGAQASNGFHTSEHVTPPADQEHEFSQRRWRELTEEHGLTFGSVMTGDALWDRYAHHHRFKLTDNILEIGPGYGRILATALDRRIPFASYIGVEISQDRVAKLRSRFETERRVRFELGDIDEWRGVRNFDVVLCSATFEHLHPDCRAALANLRRQVNPGAHLFIDFIATNTPGFHYEVAGTYVRRYPEAELRAIFTECRLPPIAIENVSIGQTPVGDVHRLLVVSSTMR